MNWSWILMDLILIRGTKQRQQDFCAILTFALPLSGCYCPATVFQLFGVAHLGLKPVPLVRGLSIRSGSSRIFYILDGAQASGLVSQLIRKSGSYIRIRLVEHCSLKSLLASSELKVLAFRSYFAFPTPPLFASLPLPLPFGPSHTAPSAFHHLSQ